MSAKEKKPDNKLIIEAIEKCFGNLSAVAKSFGVSRPTVYKWLNSNKALKQAHDDATETFLDIAENKLMAQINKGDTTAIIFALKTKGKKRGYVEKQEIEFSKTDTLNVGYANED